MTGCSPASSSTAPPSQGAVDKRRGSVSGQPVPTAAGAAISATHGNLVSAPIGSLLRAALQETFEEIAASARHTGAASSVAWLRLRHGAEKRLGLEVNIEDPAMRELFGTLLQVEDMLIHIRQQAVSLLAAADVFTCKVPAGASGRASANSHDGLLLNGKGYVDEEKSTCPPSPSPSPSLSVRRNMSDVSDAFWRALSLSSGPGAGAREWLERRLKEEVMDCIDRQMHEFELLRKQMRERETWHDAAEHAQREVTNMRKARRPSAGTVIPPTGLMALSSAVTPMSAEERLQAAQAKVTAIDTFVLSTLLELQASARKVVATPAAALARVRAEFFGALSSHWAPVAADLQAEADSAGASRQTSDGLGFQTTPGAQSHRNFFLDSLPSFASEQSRQSSRTASSHATKEARLEGYQNADGCLNSEEASESLPVVRPDLLSVFGEDINPSYRTMRGM